MKPYGIKLQDRRKMYDYGSDKFNSRGCFNSCNCSICRNKKSKIRKDTARKKTNINAKNIMRAAKKRARQDYKIQIFKIITDHAFS